MTLKEKLTFILEKVNELRSVTNENTLTNVVNKIKENYTEPELLEYDMSKIKFRSRNFVILNEGDVFSLSISGTLPEGVTVKYENNDKSEEGTYNVIAKFTGDKQHKPIPNMEAQMVIMKKGEITFTYLSGEQIPSSTSVGTEIISFSDTNFHNPGMVTQYGISGTLEEYLISGDFVGTYKLSKTISSGEYTLKVTCTLESDPTKIISEGEAKLTVVD